MKQSNHTITALLLVFILAILGSLVGTAQCSTRNLAITPALGFNKSGATLYTEIGSYSSVPLTFSYYAGIAIESRIDRDMDDKVDSTALPPKFEPFYLDAYARLAFKIRGAEGEAKYYHFITGLVSARGNAAVSYRLCRSFGDALVGIEPNYSVKNFAGINVLLTAKL